AGNSPPPPRPSPPGPSGWLLGPSLWSGGPAGSVSPDPMTPRRRNATSTSNFGVGRRESHVAEAFYSRFEVPELSADEHVNPHRAGVAALHGDARRMDAVEDDSVALVVTSP